MRLGLTLALVSMAVVPLVCCMWADGPSEAPPAPAPAVVHPEAWPKPAAALAADPALERAVSALLDRMSLEEKVGQVIQAEIGNATPEDVRRYRLGSILNGGGSHPGGKKRTSPREWVALADAYYDASMDTRGGHVAIPVLWGTDAIHGHANVTGATVFPHNIGLGATRDTELIRRIGEVTAAEIAVTGLDWDFAPTVAVVRDDRWGRTYEGFSEDPALVRRCAEAMVRGLQGDPGSPGFLDASHVVATVKHFLGDGGTRNGRDRGDNRASEEELRDVHGAGHLAGLEAGVQTVMASFSSWQGRKMHGNRDLLTAVLKERIGFDGFVIGDWNGHAELPGCSDGDCPQAFNAGVDMFMAADGWKALYGNTLAEARSGVIPRARLDEAVRRILRVKMRAGLFTRGRPSGRPLAGRLDRFGTEEHRAVARRAVRESLVLLKNAGGILPLRRDANVLVAGEAADDIGVQCGGWTISWEGDGNSNEDFPGGSSIWDGIRETVRGGGGTATLSEKGRFTSRPDVAIVVFGEKPYAETRGDRTTLEFEPESGRALKVLRALKAAGVPVVSVFLSGRPLWVDRELDASDAFVAAWLPGSEGRAVADVLFRAADGSIAHDFTGRLPYSWPRRPDQTPLNLGDPDYDPRFPYGFGLSVDATGDGSRLSAAGDPLSPARVLAVVERVADFQLAHIVYEAPLPDGGTQPVTDTEWVRGAFFAGVMAAYRATGNRAYLDAALALAEKNGWRPGPRPRHADDLCIAQTYAELHLLQREGRRIRPTVERLDAIVAQPRPGPVVGWREDDNWSWCDALFMAPPTMALIAEATGDRRYLDAMSRMWWETSAYLYDPREHLWYRDGRYVVQADGSQPRTARGRRIFWSRGNGWVLAGLARVLEHMPPDNPDRGRFVQQMREMAARLVEVQGADGFWRSSLLDAEEYPQQESSGTGFFAFGLAWGINHGVLDRATYLPAIEKAWRGLCGAVHPDGKLGWVQQIGYDPRSVGPDDAMEYGAGAFLLAGEEILTLVRDTPPPPQAR